MPRTVQERHSDTVVTTPIVTTPIIDLVQHDFFNPYYLVVPVVNFLWGSSDSEGSRTNGTSAKVDSTYDPESVI
jgi:hypothetical protein